MIEHIDGLAIQPSAGNMPQESATFTIAELFSSHCLVAFNYRQVWANVKWNVVDVNSSSDERFPELERDQYVIAETKARWLAESLGSYQTDNHQTFMVEINGLIYFVTFSDGYIWIGNTARGSDY